MIEDWQHFLLPYQQAGALGAAANVGCESNFKTKRNILRLNL